MNNYSKILDPFTNRFINVKSKKGNLLLAHYIIQTHNQLGGSGHGDELDDLQRELNKLIADDKTPDPSPSAEDNDDILAQIQKDLDELSKSPVKSPGNQASVVRSLIQKEISEIEDTIELLNDELLTRQQSVHDFSAILEQASEIGITQKQVESIKDNLSKTDRTIDNIKAQIGVYNLNIQELKKQLSSTSPSKSSPGPGLASPNPVSPGIVSPDPGKKPGSITSGSSGKLTGIIDTQVSLHCAAHALNNMFQEPTVTVNFQRFQEPVIDGLDNLPYYCLRCLLDNKPTLKGVTNSYENLEKLKTQYGWKPTKGLVDNLEWKNKDGSITMSPFRRSSEGYAEKLIEIENKWINDNYVSVGNSFPTDTGALTPLAHLLENKLVSIEDVKQFFTLDPYKSNVDSQTFKQFVSDCEQYEFKTNKIQGEIAKGAAPGGWLWEEIKRQQFCDNPNGNFSYGHILGYLASKNYRSVTFPRNSSRPETSACKYSPPYLPDGSRPARGTNHPEYQDLGQNILQSGAAYIGTLIKMGVEDGHWTTITIKAPQCTTEKPYLWVDSLPHGSGTTIGPFSFDDLMVFLEHAPKPRGLGGSLHINVLKNL